MEINELMDYSLLSVQERNAKLPLLFRFTAQSNPIIDLELSFKQSPQNIQNYPVTNYMLLHRKSLPLVPLIPHFVHWLAFIAKFDKKIERNTTETIESAFAKEDPSWRQIFYKFQDAWNRLSDLDLQWECKPVQNIPKMTAQVFIAMFANGSVQCVVLSSIGSRRTWNCPFIDASILNQHAEQFPQSLQEL